MPNTVYFYSVDSGSLAIMLPIVKSAPENSNCLWVAEGKSKFVLLSKGFDCLNIDDILKNNEIDCSEHNEILVLGCQMNTGRTVEILEKCKKTGLKTIFIFDHWSRYKDHFSGADGRLVLPDKILVMDELVRQELINIGISESNIVIVGHPSVEETMKLFSQLDEKDLEQIWSKIGVSPGQKTVLLALEPLADFDQLGLLGYDDRTTTLSVVEVTSQITDHEICLVVRLHPNQNRDKYISFLKEHNLYDKIILCPEDITQAESIFASNVVLGMTSVFLIHARVVGKPAISLQVNRTSSAASVSFKYLEDIAVTNIKDFKVALLKKLDMKTESALKLPLNGIERTWEQIGLLGSDKTFEVKSQETWQN